MNEETKSSLIRLKNITAELENFHHDYKLHTAVAFDPGQYRIDELNRKGKTIKNYPLPPISQAYAYQGELPGEWKPTVPETPSVIYGEEIDPSENKAAFFVSDLHMSDNTMGDDFLFDHLVPLAAQNLFVGNPAQGPSKAVLFQHVISFVITELQNLGIHSFDTVLGGDIYDVWEMEERGTTISPAHNAFVATCGNLRANGNPVYYARGNHDSIVPDGPWMKVEQYVNTVLKVKADHGHRSDPANKGVNNPIGSTVSHAVAIMETIRVNVNGNPTYLLTGIDNVRPTNDSAVFFLNRIGVFAPLNQLLNILAQIFRIIFKPRTGIGGFFRSILRFLSALFTGYLKVEGHTHDAVQWPKVYYNTGTWTGKLLINADRSESYTEECHFLLVYKDPNTGERVERFLVVV
jgi:hypothetical protein